MNYSTHHKETSFISQNIMKLMKGFSEGYMKINIFFSEFCIILSPNIQLQLFQEITQFKLHESQQTRNKLLSLLEIILFKESGRGASLKHRPGIIILSDWVSSLRSLIFMLILTPSIAHE